MLEEIVLSVEEEGCDFNPVFLGGDNDENQSPNNLEEQVSDATNEEQPNASSAPKEENRFISVLNNGWHLWYPTDGNLTVRITFVIFFGNSRKCIFHIYV